MELRDNKTIMCSVLFLDIVAYSKKPVSVQIAQKERLNAMLADAIRNVPVSDRVILDTGDGAAITFLGDVSDALKAALSCRDGIIAETGQTEHPLEVRMGINLGPVRLIKDLNGQPNIVGDGINVAQRIMGFAQAGQVLVSRSYHDAVSRLSHDYDSLFYSVGLRTDKHVREHEIYAVVHPGETPPQAAASGQAAGWLEQFRSASPPQQALLTGIAATALALLLVITLKLTHRPPEPELDTLPPQQETAAPPQSPETAMDKVEPATAIQNAPAAPHKAAEASSTKKHPQENASPPDRTAKPAPVGVLPAAPAPTPEAAKDSAASRAATLNFAVAPWGEVYVDGRKLGVSPPLDTLRVTPGKHVIEIRNTTFQPFTISIDVMDGEQLKIKHKFGS